MRSSARGSRRVGVDDGNLDRPRRLSAVLLLLMATQSVAGLVYSEQYRDAPWIKAAWFGNDCVSLVVAMPLMGYALVRQRDGSSRWLLIWAGTVAYAIYNYSFYLFGAALSVFLPLYVGSVSLAIVILILVLARLDVATLARCVRRDAPTRTIGGYFVFVGVGLALVWTAMWASYVFAGRPTPVEPEAFKIVAALDLSLMVPALTWGGALLWNRRPWGYVLASIAGIQAALYLIVLSASSFVAIGRGLTAAPAELPMWVLLAATTSAATALLLANVRDAAGEI